MNLEEYKGVFIYAQQVDNQLDNIAFELLGEARELAKPLNTQVTAVVLGHNIKDMAQPLAEYGADRVIMVDDPMLEVYMNEPYTHALASVINEFKPDVFLVGATAIGRDLGPSVSARVATGLTADCTSLAIGDFPLEAREGGERSEYLSPVQSCHSRMTSAEKIAIMNRPIKEDDVAVPCHYSGGRSRDCVGLHDIRPPSIVLELHLMPANLLAALDRGCTF